LKAEQRRLRNLARDVLAGYYGRLRYWREQASVRWPAWKRLAIWRHADKPETDLAHRETPKPLGGLDRRTTGSSLRKDSPHKRAAVRHNPDRPS
jgi:hypothetical protein